MSRLSLRLHGHSEEAFVALLQGCIALGDGHDLPALEQVLGEMQPYLPQTQQELGIARTAYEAVADTSHLAPAD
jgi:hypothetical protein